MKIFLFISSVAISLALLIVLNTSISGLPPLGNFMSPHSGFWRNGEIPDDEVNEEIQLDGLKDQVMVYYDDLMIPHISASSQWDLSLVHGYLTAKDRLWQMDFYARMIYGRLSEVLGDRALSFDRMQRRIGLPEMTKKLYKEAQKNERYAEALHAYAAGVNAYMDQLDLADYPIEFKLLDYEPESWTPEKSCIAYALFCSSLSRNEADLENTNAYQLFGPDLFNILFPERADSLDFVIPAGTKWNFTPQKTIPKPEEWKAATLQKTIEKPHPLNGSNNFAISKSKSQSGNVLVANELDLDLLLPSIWHAAHLQAPDMNVMGVTLPGTPMIIVGFNDSIAWGLSNSPRDQVDWYQMEFKTTERNEYLYNNKWFKTAKTIENIPLKNGDVFYDTIVHTHYGPIVYDGNYLPENGKANLAMKWVAHEPENTFKALYEINKAKNHEGFVNALSFMASPPQNVVFGSAGGTIAMHLPGRFPNKWENQGKFILDGTNPDHEWISLIPFDHHLHAVNPKQGFLSSANQHQVDTLYPYYVYDHSYEYYRNRRINDRLAVLNKVAVKDLTQLQNDNFNYLASEILPDMLEGLDTSSFSARETETFQLLSRWDYFSYPDQKTPTIFNLWWGLLYQQIWDEFDTVEIAIDRPNSFNTIHLLKTVPDFEMFDIMDTPEQENAPALYRLSFLAALDSIDQFEGPDDLLWYKYKNTSIDHLLRLAPFSEKSIKIGGGRGIVNAATKNHGPSWRMVVELSDQGPTAWGVYPGSQTGNPGDIRYGEMIDNWAAGNYYPLRFGNNMETLEGIIFTHTFKPQ